MHAAARALALLTIVGLVALPACTSESNDSSTTNEPSSAAEASAPAEAPSVVTEGPYTYAASVRPGQPPHVKCWARLMATPSPDFRNPFDSISGPVEVAYLRDLDASGRNVQHADWTGRVSGVTAGPTARVTVFETERFGGASHTLAPGETADLGAMGMAAVGSLRIEPAS